MTGTVAAIGAGPGGLVTARWLLSQGFEPTIFEAIGGSLPPSKVKRFFAAAPPPTTPGGA